MSDFIDILVALSLAVMSPLLSWKILKAAAPPCKILGPGLPTSIHVLLAAVVHFGYGGFWGGILFALTPRVTVWKGIGMGTFLYLIMQVFLFPFLGSGPFGARCRTGASRSSFCRWRRTSLTAQPLGGLAAENSPRA